MKEEIKKLLFETELPSKECEALTQKLLCLYSVSDTVKEAYQQGFNDGASAAADSIAANPERL